MAAHQAPPSLGFSRQEHWSGMPFPSPMHESEKWKWSHSIVSWSCLAAAAAAAKSLQSCPTLCDPIDGSQPGFPSLGFSRQEHWSGMPFPSPMHESEKWKWSRSVVSWSCLRSHQKTLQHHNLTDFSTLSDVSFTCSYPGKCLLALLSPFPLCSINMR